ncbi:DUF6531 domain-containing protein [Salinivibrio sp. ML290]|uniref:DUF6531 domain-containing protein n=1 Tax=Salinivibrio sp. ML290 TaxID=1909468 RepID=UPI0009885328|nr:DUF6531 domain-containing protein [Salinivibrio sp. ML290]OOE77138.1 hypothetical protein BZG23_02095 [Salinivibrio sp. ML290]
MSSNAKAALLSSSQAAQQNFSTDNVLEGGCVECACETFIRYHYDDDKPVPNAPFVLTDSKKTQIEGKTDDQGLCKIQNMGCGGYEILLQEGDDEFEPKEVLENNPVLQDSPEYAALAGEYFALYTLLNRKGYLFYDADDSSADSIDVDRSWTKWIPDDYEPAYERFWVLHREINQGTRKQKEAVQKMYSSLAGETAGMAQDNPALLLFVEIALGCVPVVGQAIDLYDLGDWSWRTYEQESLDNWHWAEGTLIAIGFVPGLGDAAKKTGCAILDALKKADSRAIQLAMKIIRSLSNGNLVKYLADFDKTLKSCAKEAKELINKTIFGLEKVVMQSDSWILRLASGAILGMIDGLKSLLQKIDDMLDWIKGKFDEFKGKIITVKPGTAHPKKTLEAPENTNAGKADPHQKNQDKANRHTNETDGDGACQPSNKCTEKGEPVDMQTGKAFELREDFTVAAHLPVSHERYYHSRGERHTGLMGRLWRSSWDISLTIEGDTALWIDKDYTQARFPLPFTATPTQSAMKPDWRLHRDSSGHLVLKHKTGLSYHFGFAAGSVLKVTKIQDSYGNSTQFVYQHATLKWVVLTDQRLIKVATERNRITALTLCERDKTVIRELAQYHYDDQGFLLSVRAEAGRNFDYQYNQAGHLIRWQDKAKTWVEHDYDEQGRALATRCAGDYWNDHIRYDDEQRIHYYKNAFGGITAYHLDERNRVVKTVAPDGSTITQTWDNDNLISQTNALGETTFYAYDDWGNVTDVMLPDGAVHAYQYSEEGHLLGYTDPEGATWTYQYNPQGDVIAATDPEGRETTLTYTPEGHRESLTEPDGTTTRYTYNELGLLARVAPQVGMGMRFEYDRQGRLCRRISDNNLVRTWHYQNDSLSPSSVCYEDGTAAYFEYDIEGNLVKVTDALGHSQSFDYDAFDLLSQAIDPLGAVTRYHYNAEAEFAGVTNSQGHDWRYTFDKQGRVVSQQHYDKRVEHYEYDAAGRLSRHTKPDGYQHQYDYDQGGRVSHIHTFDASGAPAGQTWYEYDAASRLTYAENGDAWVGLRYSPSGLLVEETLNGTTLAYQYDEAGRRIEAKGTETARQYDWHHHQLTQVQIGAHQPLDFAYTPQGQEQQRGNQQGFRLTHQWSERGLLTQQGLGQHQDPLRRYHYDALDRLIGIDDNHRGSHRFMLNPNGQVVGARQQKASQPNGRFVHLFGYDSELNLNETGFATEYSQQQHVVSLADARVQRQKRRHDRAGRVLETGRFRYRYDACGRVIEKTENKAGYRPQVTRFSWNADDRLTHIELPNGTRYRYRYDPFGRRIAKECAHSDTQTHYLWDGAHIVQQQQATADGQVLQQTEYLYEPGSSRPMAQVTHHEQGSELNYIVTDHAGGHG